MTLFPIFFKLFWRNWTITLIHLYWVHDFSPTYKAWTDERVFKIKSQVPMNTVNLTMRIWKFSQKFQSQWFHSDSRCWPTNGSIKSLVHPTRIQTALKVHVLVRSSFFIQYLLFSQGINPNHMHIYLLSPSGLGKFKYSKLGKFSPSCPILTSASTPDFTPQQLIFTFREDWKKCPKYCAQVSCVSFVQNQSNIGS